MHYLTEQNIFIFLVQVFLLLGFARGLGELSRFWKQPPITAEILVGIILGPTIFGRFLPALHQSLFPADPIQEGMLETISWLGVLFLLLEAGLETDFSSAWRHRGNALKIALADTIIPMAISFTLCFYLSDKYLADPERRLTFNLFMATVMTISAMPVAVRVLHDLHLTKTDLGFLIISALSVNDIIGWLVFTLVLGLFTQSNLEIYRVILIFVITIGFTVFCLTAGRNFANTVISKIKEKNMPEPGTSLTFICLLGLLVGAITQKLGIHALFGFFIAGIMAGQARALSEKTRQVISQMVYAIFVPLFFASIGLKVDFIANFDIYLILFVSGVGIVGRFLGAYFGVMLTQLSTANRLSVAIAHIPGGAMEIVIAAFALKHQLITAPVFVAVVFAAVISSLLVGPWLSFSVKRRREVSALEYFSPRAIVSNLKSIERSRAIEEICRITADQESFLDAENLYGMVMARENNMGTAIEEGVAIPHARLPLLKRPIIAFGRSVSGIEWNSPDGKPTQFIFLILTPRADDEFQVQILTLIAKMMSRVEVREVLLQAADEDTIWRLLQKELTAERIVRQKTNGR